MSSESLDEQLTAAQERLNEAQAAVDALNAAAPIDGTVISRTIAEGSEVKAGDAVITIQNTTTMVVTSQSDDCVLVPTTAVKSVLDAQGNKQAVVFVQREELAMAALSGVGMDDRAPHRPSQMSGGQQQRVAIAWAIAATAPRVVRLSDGRIISDAHQEVDWL